MGQWLKLPRFPDKNLGIRDYQQQMWIQDHFDLEIAPGSVWNCLRVPVLHEWSWVLQMGQTFEARENQVNNQRLVECQYVRDSYISSGANL